MAPAAAPAEHLADHAMPSTTSVPDMPDMSGMPSAHAMPGMSMLPMNGAYGEGSGTSRNPG